MDRKTAGLIGAVAGLATIGSASAAVPPAANAAGALHATSYAELLAPVENAVALVKADDGRIEAELRTVQYDRGYGYDQRAQDHHHHHHQADRRYSYNGPEHHHHHHHHHHNYNGGGVLGRLLNGR